MACLALLVVPAITYASDAVEINRLGPDNTLIRVTGDNKLILLPVEEALNDARVNVIVDGKIEKTFYVRLARNQVDYVVPFDLSPYKGKNVVFDVVYNQDRSNEQAGQNSVDLTNIALVDTFDITNREKFRPTYHHTPLYGWMNDPNGMFYKDGKWHLYYQWNPYGSKWQNMTWGHSSSEDLVNWTSEPVAIEPNGLGAVFSGSSAIDHDNTAGFGKDAVIAMYTSAGTSQMQSLAHSNDDGTSFEIYPGNPVITLESEARDPNFFFNKETGEWNLVLAHALDHEVLIFSSKDMKNWDLKSAFGKVGAVEGVWECPDLFPLEIDGKTKWVMLVNLNPGGVAGGSGIQYFVGDFDGKTFTADTDADGKIPTKWLDYGKDNYAVVSWSDAPDNRRTVIGWMSNWQYAPDVPTQQFRSANTLPREVSLFTDDDGQIYAATTPSPEVRAIIEKPILSKRSVSLKSSSKSFNLPKANEGICVISMTIDAKDARSVELILKNNAEKVIMTYDPTAATFAMDRAESGITDFSVDFPAVTSAPTFSSDGRLYLEIYIDRSSIEVFGNNGKFAMTNLVFPNAPYHTLEIKSEGTTKISDLTISPVNVSQK